MKFIYSSGGFAREFHRCVVDQYPDEQIIIVDDAAINGALTYDQAVALDEQKTAKWIVGFASGSLRRTKMDKITAAGYSFFSVIARSAILGDRIFIDDGAVISDLAIVTADAKIGKGFQCNIYSYVAHDCIVGDFVTLAPRVSVNGRVIIEHDVYIGTGAAILPGKEGEHLKIGKGAVVGAHALVTKDVEPNTTVVGTPARPLRTG